MRDINGRIVVRVHVEDLERFQLFRQTLPFKFVRGTLSMHTMKHNYYIIVDDYTQLIVFDSLDDFIEYVMED